MAWVERVEEGKKWRGAYRDAEGKKRRKTFDKKREAQAWANQMELEAAELKGLPSGEVKFSVYANEWAAAQIQRRESTRANTASLLRSHVLPRIGDTALWDITTTELQAWVGELTETHAPETIGKVIRVVRQVLDAAVREERVRSNVARAVNLPPVRPSEMTFLTSDELGQMIQLVGALTHGVDHNGEKITGTYKALVATLGTCGLRIGEAAALKRSDIVRGTGGLNLIRVRRTLSEVQGRLVEGEPKTARARRDVPIPAPVWALIEAHVETTGLVAREMGIERPRLFLSPLGRPVRSRNVRRDVIAKVVDELGKPRLRVHDLRHTAISLWIASGIDPNAVAALAGHSSVSTVFDRYGHLWPNRAEEHMRGLDLPDLGT